MPSAGKRATTLDFPETVGNEQPDSFTFNAISYGIDVDTGTHINCGVAFVAPTSGKVKISTDAQMSNNTAGQGTRVTPVVREGGTVGSGTVVLAADDANAVLVVGTGSMRNGTTKLLSGLTPGAPYNVRLEHKVTGATIGSVSLRSVIVDPAAT